ncbi:SRPBCC family protein [Natrarchaeobius oligotrophus]|uniref:SRPBCC family protein n=1 Tax=Natrarchaeobius chitinivorans TaxID=1679083 RepID=A0A3N6PFX7_NATCH|nr:SRPBCC family protein [Natrarchaeobius chitinivorans]RQG99049.1 SRPBCC family protein [Natrarchaeobius chitinivorans]
MTRIRTVRTPEGTRLEVSHVLAAPPDEIWDLFNDTTRWPEWSPVVNGVESTDRRVRAGTSGRLRVPGAWLPFTVTERSDRRWTWRVAGTQGAGHRVDDLGADRCRVAFELPPLAAGCAPVYLEALERIDAIWNDENRGEDDGSGP